jgi:hypothetical protein
MTLKRSFRCGWSFNTSHGLGLLGKGRSFMRFGLEQWLRDIGLASGTLNEINGQRSLLDD